MSESMDEKDRRGSSSSVMDAQLKRLGLSEDITSDPLKVAHELSSYGVPEWVAEALAVSLVGLAAFRTHWEAQVSSTVSHDGVFALGDCWGELIGAEALLNECLDAVTRRTLSGADLRNVGALYTSVLVLREGLVRLSERQQKPHPLMIPVNRGVLAAAERAILE